MKVERESEVAQLCLTLSDPMDCSPPGSSVHGIFQARRTVAYYSVLKRKEILTYATMRMNLDASMLSKIN